MTNLTKLKRTAMLASVAAIVSTPALAGQYGYIKSNLSQFDGPVPLIMEWKNGNFHLKQETVTIPVAYEAGLSGGTGVNAWLTDIYVRVKHNAHGAGEYYHMRKDLDKLGSKIKKDSGTALLFLTGEHLTPMEKAGQGACASHQGYGQKKVNTTIPLEMKVHYFSAGAGSPSVGPQNFHRYGNIPAMIICQSPRPQPGAVAQDKGSFKVTAIDLGLQTSSHSNTRPNPATVCKKAQLSVTVKTNQAGPVQFRLWTKKGNATTNRVINAWSSHDGKGFFNAKHQEWVEVSATTYVQAKAEEMVNAVELSTPWKSMTLHCTGAGGGGLVNDPGNANPDNQIPSKPKAPKRAFDGTAGSGFAGTPTNANPDNRIPTKPKAPKRTLQGGPGGVTAGAKPTHSQPQRAPSVKTAPAPKPATRPARRQTPDTQGNLATPQRESGIGLLLPALQKVR